MSTADPSPEGDRPPSPARAEADTRHVPDRPGDSTDHAESPSTAIPPQLAEHHRYRVLDLIASGGMGTVYRAQHLFLKRPVALKVISQRWVQNQKMRERFFQEMQAAAQLCHPNIVAVYDADVVGDTSFLVMELVDGVGLKKVVETNGPLPVRQACQYAQQTAAGMQHALESEILHRDIKPNNLMLTPQETVKILDFGLAGYLTEASAAEQSFTVETSSIDPVRAEADETAPADMPQLKTMPSSLRLTSRAMGTSDFLAPEMAGNPVGADVRADIYSLGCTLYFLLTGQVPFPGGSVLGKIARHRYGVPAPIRALRPEIPERLAAVIERMMSKSPAERFATPADVISALAPFAVSDRGAVLVVDDDPLIQTSLIIALESQGFTVQIARDGREALNVLRSGPPPRLIVLDLMMPGMDGFQFLQERQADPALADIPVVVLSGLDPASSGKVGGAVEYLLKPIEVEEIVKQIHRYIAEKDRK